MPNRIIPMIAYEDAASAIDWLIRAFGFTENVEERYTDADGVVGHAELVRESSTPSRRAIEAGANVIRPLDDSGLGFRVYAAEDLEGHRWMFAG